MARNIRWTIPFESLSGVACRVDIYDNNWPADNVTEISKDNASSPGWPAEDPFYYEEDDSDNLLEVIRTRSGYIRLIENNYGDLNELFPVVNTDRYVRVYYGTTLVFTGYIKAESYGLSMSDYHRAIDLPVISPLYLADGMFFTPPSTPEFNTIGKYMYDVINGLDSNITHVVYPDPDTSISKGILNTYLCSLAICPQKSYNDSMTSAVDFYEGKSFKYFIEGFCNAFGLMAHDEPERLVFSRFDYEGKYSSILKINLLNIPTQRINIPDSNVTELLNVDISSEENLENTILPLSKITIEGEGEFFEQTGIPTEVSQRSSGGGSYNDKSFGFYIPKNDILACDDLLYGSINSGTGRLDSSGTMIAYDGGDKLFSQRSSGDTGLRTLVYFRLYNYPKNSGFYFSFDGKYGLSVDELNNPGAGASIFVMIKNGNRYFHDGAWVETEGRNYKGFNEHQGIAVGSPFFVNQPIEIWLDSDIQYWNENYIYCLENFQVKVFQSNLGSWSVGKQTAEKEITGSPSNINGSVRRNFSRQWKNSNYLSTGIVSESGLISEPGEPLYPYLTTSQNRIQFSCKGILPDDHYLKKLSFGGYLWRLIAKSFHPWNDEYKLTLHTSEHRYNYFFTKPDVGDSSFKFTRAAGATGDLFYSTDKEIWKKITSGTPTETFGNAIKVYWRGNMTPGPNGIGTITCNHAGAEYKYYVGGDIMSLFGMNNFYIPLPSYACKNLFANSRILSASELMLFVDKLAPHCYDSMFFGCTDLVAAPTLPATTLADSCYASMFSGCTKLEAAPTLPATTLVNSCYTSMFSGCTDLTFVPDLLASMLAPHCYDSMFSGCTDLADAPTLPATTLADSCYASMFSGCTSMLSAPELPAATLAASCYASMFSRCTDLNDIKCLATDISASDCTKNWLYDVSDEGVFIKSSGMNDWPTGASGIPSGWDVDDEE